MSLRCVHCNAIGGVFTVMSLRWCVHCNAIGGVFTVMPLVVCSL